MLDRGYDGVSFQEKIKRKGIKTIVDNRIMRKGDTTFQYKKTDIYYTEAGYVYYLDYELGEAIDEETGLQKYFAPMKYVGYDKQRNSLRYSYKGKVHRLKISEDERVFNEVARDSRKFKRLYNKRTSVERYNGRLDRDYSFEKHTIRGLKKMKLMITISNIINYACIGESSYRNATIKLCKYAKVLGNHRIKTGELFLLCPKILNNTSSKCLSYKVI